MNIYTLILLFLLFSCTSKFSYNDNNIEKKDKKIVEKKEKEKIKDVEPEELSRLFYKSYVKSVKKVVKEERIIIKETNKINPEDYTVIIDWMVGGIRYVKVKNKVTMNEYVIKEGDNTTTIILVERNLFFYKFKINGTIIEVKR